MPTLDIIKAWKDEDFRDTLTKEQQAVLPKHPSGTIEFQASALGEGGLFEAKHTLHCHSYVFCSYTACSR